MKSEIISMHDSGVPYLIVDEIVKYCEVKKNTIQKLVLSHLDDFIRVGLVLPVSSSGASIKWGSVRLHYKSVLLLSSIMKGHNSLFVELLSKSEEDFMDAFYNYIPPNRKCYLYLVQLSNDTVKIGITVNPRNRLRTIETQSGLLIVANKVLEFGSAGGARKSERRMHTIFRDSRIHGEYFAVDFDVVAEKMVETKE